MSPWPQRRGDWEAALSDWLIACAHRPYVFGEHDCGLFSAGAVLAMTGADPAEPFRGRYNSKWSAEDLLADLGHDSLESYLDSLFPQVPAGRAQRGDLAWHDGAVGVVAGSFALFVGQIDDAPGLVRVPRAMWAKAWAVGRAVGAA